MGGSRGFYDEDGHYHYHEANSSRGQAHCSNGHIMDVTRSTKCTAPGCDFGHEERLVLVPSPEPEPEREREYVRWEGTIAFPNGGR
ncbi:hypothetical protein FHT44_005168 [Mycolicibacterium sp. BK634]|uniref:hypothetical protein n=1 Tax=Mycolicibacterium sp. BK634 TaxID=2587099 RepID=UPI001619BCC2|nr:hypothetical protein [Mycolicibacterium sp. BK634]MBB3752656.1 hypothetical protein [Mycolicibacterium sp. BK634]